MFDQPMLRGGRMANRQQCSSTLAAIVLVGLYLAIAACSDNGTSRPSSTAACDGLPGITGSIRKVKDGDTFRLAEPDGTITDVRLDQIDAPEKAQPWSNRSREQLRDLLGQGQVCVVGTKRDKYGRLLGEVHANGLVVNTEMVRLGAAWAYRHYLRDKKLLDLEAAARASRVGLWSMPPEQTIAPWEFRHPELAATESSSPPQQLSPFSGTTHLAPECAAKPRCRQMQSCEEAKMWLAKCGGEGIDGDGDGIPCEKICAPKD